VTANNTHPHTLSLSLSLTHTQLTPRRSLLKSCSAKCIDASYREADLNKGESVCLDRCVSKFFEVNVKVSEKMQGEAQGKQGGAGMFGGGM
jgi:import inner membrane translocase subunit TIM10